MFKASIASVTLVFIETYFTFPTENDPPPQLDIPSPEIHLQQRRHRMYVLQDVLGVEIRYPILVEGVPQLLYVGRHPRQPVDPVDDTVTLYELGAALEDHRNVVSRIQQVLPQVATEHPLLQYARLLEPPPRRSVQDEAPKERDQLAVLPQDGLDRRQRQRPAPHPQ